MPALSSKISIRKILLLCALLYMGGILFQNIASSDEDKISADLQSLATAAPHIEYIRQFDLICFGVHVAKTEFLSAAGNEYRESLQNCGTNGSCCNPDSDAGIVGLGKNGQMRCIEIRNFDYWTDKNSPLCTSPGKLRIKKQTEDQAVPAPGKPQFSEKRTSFRIDTTAGSSN